MTTWFTSDWHLGHKRIIDLSYRPFDTVEDMNESLIRNFNEMVSDDDHTFFLGDMCMGGYSLTLPLIGRLNGTKTLIVGNHDKPFTVKSSERLMEVLEEYHRYFDDVRFGPVVFEGFMLSHFPYHDDYQGREYPLPSDHGITIIHGHTHEGHVVSRSESGTLQVHVGVDAWGYRPVHFETIEAIVRNNSTRSI